MPAEGWYAKLSFPVFGVGKVLAFLCMEGVGRCVWKRNKADRMG